MHPEPCAGLASMSHGGLLTLVGLYPQQPLLHYIPPARKLLWYSGILLSYLPALHTSLPPLVGSACFELVLTGQRPSFSDESMAPDTMRLEWCAVWCSKCCYLCPSAGRLPGLDAASVWCAFPAPCSAHVLICLYGRAIIVTL